MKKTRFLSMLLAVVMLAVSVPVLSVPAAAASTASANLFDGATANVTVKNVTELDPATNQPTTYNEYITARVYAQEAWDTFNFNYTLSEADAARELHVEFDSRISLMTANPQVETVPSGDKISVSYADVANGVGQHRMRFNISTNDNQILVGAQKFDGTWVHTDAVIPAKAAGNKNYISFTKHFNAQMYPVDFDNVGIYYLDGENKVYVVGPLSAGFKNRADAYFSVPSANYTLTEYGHGSYSRITAPESGYTTVTYTLSESLTPGYYEFGGSARIGAYYATGYSMENNSFTLDVSLGNAALEYDVNDGWKDMDTVVKVTQPTNTVTFTLGAGVIDNGARDLDLADLSLTYVGPIVTDADNLFDGASVSGATLTDVKSTSNTVTEYNDFMRVYNRVDEDGQTGFQLPFTLTAEQAAGDVYISYDKRMAIPGDSSTIAVRLYVNGWSGDAIMPKNPAGLDWGSHVMNLAAQKNNGSSKLHEGVNTIGFFKDQGGVVPPYDVDNLAIYTIENGVKNYIVGPITDDFNDYIGTLFSPLSAAKIAAESESEYYAAAAGTGNTAVSFTLKDEIAPGYYVLTGEANLYEHVSSTTPAETNSTVITVSDGNTEYGTVTADNSWREFHLNLKVDEATDTFTFTADGAKAINLANLSLVCTDEFYPDSTVAVSLAALEPVTTGAVTVKNDADRNGGGLADIGNGYLQVAKRPRWGGLRIMLPFDVTAGTTYYLSMDVRSSVPNANRMSRIRTDIVSEYKDGSSAYAWRRVEAQNDNYMTPPADWRTIEFKVTPTADKSGAYITVIGGPGNNFASPIDFDNIRFYTRAGNVDGGLITPITPVYDFEDGTVNSIFGAQSSGAIPTLTLWENQGVYNRMAVSDTGANAAITYAPADTTLEAGVYKITGEMRYADYVTQSADGVSSFDDNISATAVTAVVGGNTLELGSVDVTTEWTDVTSDTFTVYTDTPITEVKMATDNSTAQFDFKNFSVVRVGDAVRELAIAPASIEAEVGDEPVTLKVVNTLDANDIIASADVAWSSTDDEVAKVSDAGVVSFIGEGEAKIKAEFDGKSCECTVTVTDSGEPVDEATSVDLAIIVPETAGTGSEITVQIVANNASDTVKSLEALDFGLTYDSDVLTFMGIEPVAPFDGELYVVDDTEPLDAVFAYANNAQNGVDPATVVKGTPTVIAEATFKVGNTLGETDISIVDGFILMTGDTTYNGYTPTLTNGTGTVEIISSIEVEFILKNGPTEAESYAALAEGTKIAVIKSDVNDTIYTYSGKKFYYSEKLGGYAAIVADTVDADDIKSGVTGVAGEADAIVYNGDVTGDGKTLSGDAAMVSAMLHKPNGTYSDYARLAADVTDGVSYVTTADAMWILKESVGLN